MAFVRYTNVEKYETVDEESTEKISKKLKKLGKKSALELDDESKEEVLSNPKTG